MQHYILHKSVISEEELEKLKLALKNLYQLKGKFDEDLYGEDVVRFYEVRDYFVVAMDYDYIDGVFELVLKEYYEKGIGALI